MFEGLRKLSRWLKESVDRAEEAFRQAAVEPVRNAATWVLGLVRNTLLVTFIPLILILVLLGLVHPAFFYAAGGGGLVLVFLLGLGYHLRRRVVKTVEQASLKEVAELSVDSALAGVMFWVYAITIMISLLGLVLGLVGYLWEITPLLVSGIVSFVAGLTALAFSYLVVNFFKTFLTRGVMRFLFGAEEKKNQD